MSTVARYHATGRNSRCARHSSHCPGDESGRQPYVDAAAPAKKNSGRICRSHVIGCRIGTSESVLPNVTRPSWTETVSISEWPAMTTISEVSRIRSTTRSRLPVMASSSAGEGLCVEADLARRTDGRDGTGIGEECSRTPTSLRREARRALSANTQLPRAFRPASSLTSHALHARGFHRHPPVGC